MVDFFANPGAWLEQAGKDLAQGGQDFGETLQDGAQVIYDVFNPNNPDPNWVVDQIENTIDQQPTPDYIAGPDFNEPAPELPSPNPPGFNDPDPVLPSPIAGPDFNNPVPELPSPESNAFDSLTNPDPILGGDCFEFGDVGVDALSIDSTSGAAITTIEDLQGFVAAGGYDSIDSMNESLMDSMNSIFEVADITMF